MALALRWTALEAGPTLQGVLDLNRATDWPSFKAAMRQWEAPCINMVYADTEGNIGYHLLGHVPRRARGQGVLPAPGWSREYDWDGYIPFEELPQSYNPACGYVVTANNRIAGPAYPYFLGREWATGYRARRIADRLEATARHTLDDFAAIQNDVHSIPGRLLSAVLVERLGGRPVTGGERAAMRREALERLGAWDGSMGRESVAASIYEVTLHFLTRRVYGLALPDESMLDLYLGRATQPVTNSTNYVARSIPRMLRALHENDLRWLRSLAVDPEAAAALTWDDALEASLDEGLRLLRRKLGPRMAALALGAPAPRHPGPPARGARPAGAHLQSAARGHARRPRHDLHDGGAAELAPARQRQQRFLSPAIRPGRLGRRAGDPGRGPGRAAGLAALRRHDLAVAATARYAPLPFSAEAVAAATVNELTLRPPD